MLNTIDFGLKMYILSSFVECKGGESAVYNQFISVFVFSFSGGLH